MSNARDDQRSKATEPGEADAPGKFFLAVFESGLRESRVFRAYPEADGISFVYAGPVMPLIDPEVARGKGHGDWKTKAAQTLKTGFLAGAGVAALAFGILIVIAGRLVIRG